MHNNIKSWRVYVAYDQLRQRVYIGQTSTTMKRRIICHVADSKRHSSQMNRHVHAYGAGAFAWTVVEDNIRTRDEAVAIEAQLTQDYIDNFGRDSVLNDGCGDSNGPSLRAKHLGKKRSVESRLRMSAAQTGRKLSAEVCAKMSASRTGSRNGRYNSRKYLFAHDIHGFVLCTQRELVTLFCLDHSPISAIVRGKKKSHKGWTLVQRHTTWVQNGPRTNGQ